MMLSTNDVAQAVAIGRRAVQKSLSSILPCGKRGKADLFRIEDVAKKYPAVLQHFKIAPETTPTPTARKSRNDAGATRRVSAEDFERICAETKRQYLAVAMPNALLAVRSALAELGDTVNLREFAKSGNTKNAHSSEAEQYFYKRIFERPDCIAKREQWRILHTQTWRKNDFANKVLPTLRYDLPVMCWNESLVPGSVFVIDDHTTDVRTSEEQYLRSVAVMCGWTGRVLAVEFADVEGSEGQTHGSARTSGEISARHIAMAVLRAAGRFGRPELIVMENSKVMKAEALEGLLLALYTPQEIHNVPTWITKITHGQGRIARNKPHIPRFPFKGMLERNFAEFKKHDYTTYALTYGSRAEAVQLEIAGKFHAELAPQAEQYVRSLAVYVESEFLCAHRGVKFSGLAKRSGVACKTIESAWGMLMQNANNSGKYPVQVATASVAMIVFNLAKLERINVKPVAARLGFADVVRGGVAVRYQWSAEYWNLLAGRKVAAIEYDDAVFIYEIDGENVRYACTAWRASVESADDVPALRARQRWERERYEAGGRHIGGRHIGLPVQAGGAQLSESGCARLQDVQDVIEMQDKGGRGEPLWSPIQESGQESGQGTGQPQGLPQRLPGGNDNDDKDNDDDEQLNRLLNL